jgi:hypothetical protein
MSSLNLVHEIGIKGNPINPLHVGGPIIFIQIGLNVFIVFGPKLINEILFHRVPYSLSTEPPRGDSTVFDPELHSA